MRRGGLLFAGVAILVLLLLYLNRTDEEPQPPPPLSDIDDPASPPGSSEPYSGTASAPPPAPSGPRGGPVPPPAPTPEPKISLTVTVVDEAGQPVAGASVLVLPHGVYQAGGGFGGLVLPPCALYTAVTDAGGRVEFEHPGKYLDGVHLFARTPDQARGAVSKAFYWRQPGRHGANLAITRATPVRGRVVDADGRRVEDARVSLVVHDVYTSWSSSIGPYGFRLDPTHLEHGEFEFPPVPESERMTLSSVAAKAEGYLPAEFDFEFGKERPDEVVVRMLRPVRVIGRVVTAAGRPVAGARVRRFPGDPLEKANLVTTDESGTFAFAGMPEDGAVVSVATPDGVPFRVSVGRVHGREKDLGDLAVDVGRTIEGVVVDDDGAPVPGVAVSIYRREIPESSRSVKSGPDGRFAIPDLGEGDHLLLVHERAAPRGWTGRKGRVAGVPSGAKDVRVVLTGGMLLAVHVKFPPGQEPGSDPAYLHVHLDRVNTPEEPFMQEIWDRGRYSLRLRVRKPGTFTLSVTMAGYSQARETITVNPERETSTTVTLVKK